MTKDQYIERIVTLLKKCNNESIFYFILCFLEKQIH